MKLKLSGTRRVSKAASGIIRFSVSYSAADVIHVEGRIINDECWFKTWRPAASTDMSVLPKNWIMV